MMIPKRIYIRDKKHLAFVGTKPCMIRACYVPTIPHHLLQTGSHGMGKKSSDSEAVPLCDGHHKSLHGQGRLEPMSEKEWFCLHGWPDYEEVKAYAASLYDEYLQQKKRG